MRDVEDLILRTIKQLIVDGTDVPSEKIFLKRPAPELFKKQDGPNAPKQSELHYPVVSITYWKNAVINPNNYGEKKYVTMPSGMVKEYKPLAEIKLKLAVHLFTDSRKDQRELGNQIYFSLFKNRLVSMMYDEIPGEYFGINFNSMAESPDTNPYHKIFFIDVDARILDEVINYSVDSISTGLSTVSSGNNYAVSGIVINTDANDS